MSSSFNSYFPYIIVIQRVDTHADVNENAQFGANLHRESADSVMMVTQITYLLRSGRSGPLSF